MTTLEWDPAATGPAGAGDAPATVYPNTASWVEQWWLRIIRRPGMPWCPRWWAHPEAASRLGALWAAWETANAEGGAAMSHWWVYHCDGHLATLADARGPFAACGNGHRAPPSRLPYERLPLEGADDS